MRILGINRTQDASLTLFDKGKHVFSIQKERLTKIKHHWGKPGDIALYKQYSKELSAPADLVVQCFSSDSEFEKLDFYNQELITEGVADKNTEVICMPHHLAHLFSLYPHTRFSDFAVVIIDAIGSKIDHLTEEFDGKSPKLGEFEISSFYSCKNHAYKCIKKQTTLFSERDNKGLGKFYSHLRKAIFPGEGNEGKVMGLAAHGNGKAFGSFPKLIVDQGNVTIPDKLIELLKPGKYLFDNADTTFQEKADLAAFGQYLFENALFEIIEWLIIETGQKKIAYAGGCALNCVANGKLKERFKDIEFYIPPAPNDAGTSIGCAVYGNYIKENKIDFNWSADYLGKKQDDLNTQIQKSCERLQLDVMECEAIETYTADLVAKGYIIGVYQSRSEFGPRALGNRSIICDARYDVLKYHLNANIKGREWFRPIAPIIAEEDVNEYFINGYKSGHMMYCMEIDDRYKNRFLAINHPDNRMRVQTVNKIENKFIYNVLGQMKDKYGVPFIANTSFNGPDETIVESITDALMSFKKYPIHYLICPPFVVTKKANVSSVLNLKASSGLCL